MKQLQNSIGRKPQPATTNPQRPCSTTINQQPDQIFYQGLAQLKLGDLIKAFDCFNNLLQHGNAHLNDEFKIDYFAVSLPDLLIWDDNLNRRNEIHCHYLIGLGLLGLGETKQAKTQFQTVISMDLNHTGAQIHQQLKI
jgi:tetratricopeptide (TPR) repeat protein